MSARARGARRCPEPLERRLAQRGARIAHAHDRRGEVVGADRRSDRAVYAVLDELGRRVVGPVHDNGRDALRRRLDHHEAVALALRRQDETQRCGQSALQYVTVDKARCHDPVGEPGAVDRGEHVVALRAVP